MAVFECKAFFQSLFSWLENVTFCRKSGNGIYHLLEYSLISIHTVRC